jgi:transcription elongation factor
MTPEEYQARSLYELLQPGDRVEVVHGVTVGSSAKGSTTTVGSVVHMRLKAKTKVKVRTTVIAIARIFQSIRDTG